MKRDLILPVLVLMSIVFVTWLLAGFDPFFCIVMALASILGGAALFGLFRFAFRLQVPGLSDEEVAIILHTTPHFEYNKTTYRAWVRDNPASVEEYVRVKHEAIGREAGQTGKSE